MNISRTLAAVAAATIAIAVTAVLVPRTDPDADAAARDAGPVLVSTPAKPAAWVQGTTEGLRLGLLSLRRSGPRVVTAKLRLTADRTAARSVLDGRVDLGFLSEDYDDDLSGARLVDEVRGKVIAPMLDPDGSCVCSAVDDLTPGRSIDVYAKFLVPTEVDRVSLELPTFAPFDGVVLPRQ